MYHVLGETVIEGIKTTIPFLRTILSNERFIRGEYSTHFVDEILSE
jgi:biotin carboxylase